MLGQVEGRAPSDAPAWLAGTPRAWREQIADVAIDMSPGYRATIRTPCSTPRSWSTTSTSSSSPTRCSTWSAAAPLRLRGRRGRSSDPEGKAGRRLLRNREDLTDEQFTRMWNQLIDTGTIGMPLLTAWIAKEWLRDLLTLARTSTDRHLIGHLRWKFLTWCADTDIPEVRTLARTIDRWWPEIAAFIATGHSNAKSERINRMIKLAARAAHGFLAF